MNLIMQRKDRNTGVSEGRTFLVEGMAKAGTSLWSSRSRARGVAPCRPQHGCRYSSVCPGKLLEVFEQKAAVIWLKNTLPKVKARSGRRCNSALGVWHQGLAVLHLSAGGGQNASSLSPSL